MKLANLLSRFALCAFILVVAATSSPAQKSDEPEKQPEYRTLGEYVNPNDSLPHVRYFEDRLVTLNDRCPILKGRLNPRMPAAYVNGLPIGFC